MIRRICLYLLTLLLLGTVRSEALDDLQAELVRGYGLPLRWYNTGGEPLASGWRPQLRLEVDPRRRFDLAPGEDLVFWLPAWEIARIDAEQGEINADQFEISCSAGGGLFRIVSPTITSDRRSLLVIPDSQTPLLIRVARKGDSTDRQKVALYVSQREPLGEIAPYRHLLPLPLTTVPVGRPGLQGDEPFWLLPAGQKVSLALSGPGRIAVESRLQYPPAEGKRRQTYRIFATFGNAEPLPLEFTTTAESEPASVSTPGGALLGIKQRGYLEIPKGAQVMTLQGSATVLLKLMRQPDPDYLLPQMNAPAVSAAELRSAGKAVPPQSSFLALSEKELERDISAPQYLQQQAENLARDLSRQSGGGVGAALLRAKGLERPDYPPLRRRSAEFAGYYTAYRSLLPFQTTPESSLYHRWFSFNTLKEEDAHPLGTAYGKQHISELAATATGAMFFRLKRNTEASYRLSEQQAPLTLRLVVDAGEGSGGVIELLPDSGDPVRFRLSNPPVLPSERYGHTSADAGLLLLQQQHRTAGEITLSGPFATLRRTAPRINAYTAEVRLPSGVRGFRLRRVDNLDTDLAVAVQKSDGVPYSWTESEFLATSAALGSNGAAFEYLMQVLRNPEKMQHQDGSDLKDSGDIARREAMLATLPFARLIRGLEQGYTAGIEPSTAEALLPAVSPVDLEATAAKAERASRRGDWLVALETWGELIRQGVSGTLRRDAVLGRARALAELNEQHLLDQYLKGLLLHDTDPEVRTSVYGLLLARYRRDRDLDNLLALQATMLLRTGYTGYLAGMVRSLLGSGEHDAAMQALILLPQSLQKPELMLQASHRTRWWRLFDRTLQEVSDPAMRAYWSGMQKVQNGDYFGALTQFRQGGTEGSVWEKHLQEGLRIRDMLAQRPADDQLIRDWEAWQASQPGARSWRSELESFVTASGSYELVSIPRGLKFQAMLATGGRPAVVRLAGPVKIRIEGRPLHQAETRQPLDGWMSIRDGAADYLQPIIANLPARGVTITSEQSMLAGRKVVREISLGPGLHQLEIDAGAMPLLVRMEALRPDLPSPALPPLTPELVEAALSGTLVKQSECREGTELHRKKIILVSGAGQDGRAEIPLIVCPQPATSFSDIPNFTLLPLYRAFDQRTSHLDTVSADEQLARHLASKNPEEALSSPFSPSPEAVLRRAHLLLWLAEQKPQQYQRALAELRVLAANNSNIEGLAAVVSRASRKGTWVPVTSIISSAGLRAVEVKGWQPESPVIRVRKSFITPLNADEQLLYDDGNLVLSMHNLNPIQLEITLRREELPYMPPAPLEVVITLSGGRVERVRLAPEQSLKRLKILVPAGDQAVRINLQERYIDQLVRIGFSERPFHLKGSVKGYGSGSRPVTNTKRIERFYQVATAVEPLVVMIQGPAVLRKDEVGEDGKVRVSYQMIPEGNQKIKLLPEQGSSERLLRLFTQSVVSPRQQPKPRIVTVQYLPVPPPRRHVELEPPTESVTLHDPFTLGRQQNGTWSLKGSIWNRQSSDDDMLSARDRFAEFSGTYRYFDGADRYARFSLLGRVRESGGPTFGLLGSLAGSPATLPFSWQVGASFYLQDPGGTAFKPFNGYLQNMSMLQGKLFMQRDLTPETWHRPFVSVFGRLMTMTDAPSRYSGAIDQDIYTSYREQHRSGLIIGDQLYHRPWLDTVFTAGGSLASNELPDLRPDNVALTVGWQQLLGMFHLDIENRLGWYLADQDRSGDRLRNKTSLDLVWERWLNNLDRIELGLGLDYVAGSRDLSGSLYLIWHIGAGRGYRDFSPGEIRFQDIRRRMMPSCPNSVISYE